MKRRDLLIKLKGKDETQSASLNERTSSLTYSEALHLLRRVSFHPTPEQVLQIVGKTPVEAYELIVGTGSEQMPAPTQSMNSWLNVLEENPLENLPQDIKSEIEGRHRTHYFELINWWLDNMRSETFPSMEKFTLFLHSIWSIEFTYDTLALLPPPLLYRNNDTLRKNRLSDYNKIAEAVSQDGAMIMYQSLFYSGKSAPNENYMRELMELFTMGIGDLETGSTNYTEGDIREGARGLTGWRTVAYLGQNGAPANRPFETFFVKAQHDTGGKKIMQFGQIAPITDDENTEDLVRTKEVNGLIDILFSEKGLTISRFICEKILRFFVYSDPGADNMPIINELAQFMQSNNYNLKKVYKKLFTSEYFFSDEVRGCQIKTPPEFIIGLERMFGVDFDSGQQGKTLTSVSELEQILYDPPNVGSWKAYRTWLSTTTYPIRIKYSKEMLTRLSDTQLINLVKKFPDYNSNFTNLLSNLTLYFLPVSLSQPRLDTLKQLLQNGMQESEWLSGISSNNASVAQGIRQYLERIIVSPDFQLC
ncbi:MAG: DUF1800 family protein [Bacteroidetes bacterium]|nr:MAG: DUF1800 family protein [Bacteroidota bacterium]